MPKGWPVSIPKASKSLKLDPEIFSKLPQLSKLVHKLAQKYPNSFQKSKSWAKSIPKASKSLKIDPTIPEITQKCPKVQKLNFWKI